MCEQKGWRSCHFGGSGLDSEGGEILGEFTFDEGKTILQTTLREINDGQLHRLFITRSAGLEKLRLNYLQLKDK